MSGMGHGGPEIEQKRDGEDVLAPTTSPAQDSGAALNAMGSGLDTAMRQGPEAASAQAALVAHLPAGGSAVSSRSVAAPEPAFEEDRCFVVEWRIDHLLEGSTYCLPVTAAGRPESDVILEAIAVEISEDFLACCVIEYRQLDTDEPWQILQFGDKPTPSVVTESLLGALERVLERVLERLKEALAPELTEDQRVRLAVLLQGGSS